jgi:hypothetical protein
MDFIDEYDDPVRTVSRDVLKAELGRLHLQNPKYIKDEIRQIIEREAVKVEIAGESE